MYVAAVEAHLRLQDSLSLPLDQMTALYQCFGFWVGDMGGQEDRQIQ